MKGRAALVPLAAILAASAVYGMSQISRSVTGAGAVGGTATSHQVHSTLGQSVVGAVSAAGHSVRSGFWLRSTT